MPDIYSLPNLPPLPYKYRSQRAVDSKKYADDCGPACTAILLETHLGKHYTIDELSQHTKLQYSDLGTNGYDLQALLQTYGLIAQAETGVMFYALMQNMINSGLGTIVLVNYGYIKNKENQGCGNCLHWVIVTGWAKNTKGTFDFFVQDPDWMDNTQNSGGHNMKIPEEQLFGAFISAGRSVVYVLRIGDIC